MADIEKGSSVQELEQPKDSVPAQVTVSADRQAFIRRKFDRRVLPIVCCLYVLSYLDRGNIGNARTAGLQSDLNINDSQWAWVLNCFYLTYVLFEWTQLFWKIFPAHIYVSTLCVLWGTAAMCSGVAHNLGGLMATRAFLGVFEAAFGAGAPNFLSLFYQRKELGKRVAVLLGMSPLANCFASSPAYGITHIRGSLDPWRLLFLIEGAPTVLFAIVVFFWLVDSPGTAKFLTEAERTEATERLQTIDRTAKSKIQWSQVVAGLTDYKNYTHALIHFCCNYSFAALSNFLPTIVRDMGYDSIRAQGLTAPAYLTAFICCLFAAFVSDRYAKRGYIVAGFAAVGAVGYAMLAGIQRESATGSRYAAVFLACCGIYPALSINITWLLNNQGGYSKKGAGLAILATFGQTSSFFSSPLFPRTDAPFYVRGCAVGCALTCLICFLSMFLHFALERENKRRDRVFGEVDENAQVDVTNGGDSRHFCYLT